MACSGVDCEERPGTARHSGKQANSDLLVTDDLTRRLKRQGN